MDYFNGLTFVCAGEDPKCGRRTRKYFDGYYGIQYTHSGTILLSVDHAEPLRLEGPHVFITRPGPFFDYGAPDDETRHHVFCCFRGPRVEQYLQHGLLNLSLPYQKITRPEEFLSAMQMLLLELSRPDGWDSARAVHLLESVLLNLQEQPVCSDENNRLVLYLEDLAEQIRLHPEYEWDIRKEAENAGVSEPYLRKLFARRFGMPPHRFLLESRIRLASDLLIRSDDPISEVAFQAGFDDPFYFSRIFKKLKKIPPARYRSYCGL